MQITQEIAQLRSDIAQLAAASNKQEENPNLQQLAQDAKTNLKMNEIIMFQNQYLSDEN